MVITNFPTELQTVKEQQLYFRNKTKQLKLQPGDATETGPQRNGRRMWVTGYC